MPGKSYQILVINLGSTSSKVAAYQNEDRIFAESLNHPRQELEQAGPVLEQYEYRLAAVSRILREHELDFGDFDILVSRGGNTRPVPGGIYLLNQAMLEDMRSGRYGLHPTYNGNKIAYEMGKKHCRPAICLDPPVTDEFCDQARLTGLPEIRRASSGHVLNQKATARKIAAELGRPYQELALIICHLGGGISVGAHKNGRLVDMNNALDGDGPMAPERAGSLPAGALVDLCFSGRYSQAEIRKKLTGQGGWMAHLGTADGREVLRRAKDGDLKAAAVLSATLYQVVKQIGAMAAVLGQDLDGIGLTGSLAHSPEIVEEIRSRCAYLQRPLFVQAGENEMEALCAGALRYLRGQEQAQPFVTEEKP